MRRIPSVKWVCLLAAVTAAVAGAHAQSAVASALTNFAADVRDYNLVAVGATTTSTFQNYGDTQGALAVRGNLNLETNGDSLVNNAVAGDTDPTLLVGGKLSLTGQTKLLSGTASIGSIPTGDTSTWTGGNDLTENHSGSYVGDLYVSNGQSASPLSTGAPAGWNWTTVANSLVADSATLANAANINGTTVIAGTISVDAGQNLVFDPNSAPAPDSTVIFTLDAKQLIGTTYNGSNFSTIALDVPSDVNYVINVINANGTTASPTILFDGGNFNESNDNNALWNIEGSGVVELGGGGSFYGSVLAPSATIENLAGTTTINGQVAASAFNDSGDELHFVGFSPVAVVIPEPATFALWGLGLCGLAIFARRRLIG